jgi:hypothetical protein
MIKNIRYGDTVCQKYRYTSKCFTNPNRMNNNGSAVVPILQNKTNLSTGSFRAANFDVHFLLCNKAGFETVTAEQMSETLANIRCAHR